MNFSTLTLEKVKNHPHWILVSFGLLNSIITFCLPMVLVRILSVEDYGLYKTFFTILLFIPFMSMSGGPLNSLYYWLNQKNDISKMIKANYALQVILGLCFFILSILVVSFTQVLDEFELKTKFFLIIIGIISCPTAYFSEYLIAKGETFKGSILYLIFEIIKVLGFIFTAYFYDLNTLFIFYFFYNITCFVFSIIMGIKYNIIGVNFSGSHLIKAVSYSLPLSFSAFVFYFIERVDHLFLIKFFTVEDYAFYAVGCLVFPPILILETSFQKNLIPRLTNYIYSRDIESVNSLIKWYINRTSSLMIPIAIFTFFFSDQIITFLYGEKFQDAGKYLQLFSITYLLPIIPYDSIQRSSNNTKSILLKSVQILLIYLTVLFITGPYLNQTEVLTISLLGKILYRLYIFYSGTKTINLFLSIPYLELFIYTFFSLVCLFLVLSFQSMLTNTIITSGIAYCLLYSILFYIKHRFFRDKETS